jgi:Helitron helicase-like domain at N-terminus
VTINPLDYEDSIAQILVGEKSNMESFMNMPGQNASEHARNMANDPFASASFFYFIIRMTLECLFTVEIHTQKGQVNSQIGIFGYVNEYFGVVEAQERGLLHVHMLLWLKDAPNADEMLELLTLSPFWERVATYLDHNIRMHLDGFDKEYVKNHE